jgi:hypothetical protein
MEGFGMSSLRYLILISVADKYGNDMILIACCCINGILYRNMTVHPRFARSVYTSNMASYSHIASARANTQPPWRWAVVLVVAIILHLIALEWANGHISLPSMHDEADIITTVQLEAPTLPARLPQPIVKPPPKPKPVAKPRPHPTFPAPIPEASVAESNPAPTAVPDPDTSGAPNGTQTPVADDNKVTANEPAVVEPPAPAEPAAATPVEKEAPIHYKIDLPPSAELEYNVHKVSADGSGFRGSGTITWQSADGNYQVTGEASWLFITALHFKSEGVLNDYGIAPVLYSEKHFNRSETDTHFNRDERNSISFSASTVSYPQKGGEQDRGSIMWQLAGIGRGDREKFVPGAQIDLFVAGVRDGDIWSILVVGQEEIEVGGGKTTAWHVVRNPHPGTYDEKIDIWLAPQYQWSPVKIRYTYKDGGYLDMSMSSFHQTVLAETNAEPAR